MQPYRLNRLKCQANSFTCIGFTWPPTSEILSDTERPMSHTRAVLAFCLSGLVASLGFPSSPANTHSTGGTTDAYTASPIFDELAERAGLKFRHFNGMTGKLFLPEVMGAGAALFDFDNDGDLDVFLVRRSKRAISLRARPSRGASWGRREGDFFATTSRSPKTALVHFTSPM